MKSKLAAYAFSFCVFSTLVTLSTTPASAGMYKYRASQGKIMNYVGCPKPDRVAHIMAKHPELYGKPPASFAALKRQQNAEAYRKAN